jgi:hypothetical protein
MAKRRKFVTETINAAKRLFLSNKILNVKAGVDF